MSTEITSRVRVGYIYFFFASLHYTTKGRISVDLEKKIEEWKKACDAGKGWEWLSQQPTEVCEAIRATEDYQIWEWQEIEKADSHNCQAHLIPYDSEHFACSVCGALISRSGCCD
jgi:hypothetical protein